MGKANAVTIGDLVRELLPIRVNTMEIREAAQELYFEGIPIVISPELPRTIYFAQSEDEINEWWEMPCGPILEMF